MTTVGKIKWVVFPSLLVIGIGFLEIQYPHALDGFHHYYAGRRLAGLIAVFFGLFIKITWGRLGGTLAILLGVAAIVMCFLPRGKQTESEPSINSVTENDENLFNTSLSSIAFNTGKAYIQHKLRNQRL